MLVQDFLRRYQTYGLTLLEAEYGIYHVMDDEEKRVILNYDMRDSSHVKYEPIVRECRGLCLEVGTWNVVARSFPRFYNYAEAEHIHKDFDWNSASCLEKVDGSLILFYNYAGKVYCNTRGSFATGEMNGLDRSWDSLVWSIIDPAILDGHLAPGHTFVCELVSPYNKVVREYNESALYLLTIYENNIGFEYGPDHCDKIAKQIGLKRPNRYNASCLDDLCKYIEEQNDATFEGFVLVDKNGMRVKHKNPDYVKLHHLKNNGNVFLPQYLIPLIITKADEKDEILANLKELRPAWEVYEEKLNEAFAQLEALWNATRYISSQKDFALAIMGKTPFTSVLFNVRKSGTELSEVWKSSTDLMVKVFEG